MKNGEKKNFIEVRPEFAEDSAREDEAEQTLEDADEQDIAINEALRSLDIREAAEKALQLSFINRHLGSGHDVVISYDYNTAEWTEPYTVPSEYDPDSELDGGSCISINICDCDWSDDNVDSVAEGLRRSIEDYILCSLS